MKRLALAVLLAVCGVNADDYEEFLEYKKWQEQKAKSQGKDSAKSGDSAKDSAKANAIDSTQEDYKNLLKSRKDSNQGNSTKTSDSAKNMANKTQDSTKSLDSKSISQLKSGGFIGVNLGGGLTMDATLNCVDCTFNGNNTTDIKSTFNLSHFDAGILGGYTHFFIPYVGLRGYGGFDYGIAMGEKVDRIDIGMTDKTNTTKANANYYLITIGADLLAEYAFGENRHFSVGAVLGLGGGYMMYRSNEVFNNLDWFNKFGLIFNAGVSFGFLHKHRIELLARLTPFIDFIGYNDNSVSLNNNSTFSETHSQVKWLGLLSYKYTF